MSVFECSTGTCKEESSIRIFAGKRGESEFVWEKEPRNSEEMGKEKEASSAKWGKRDSHTSQGDEDVDDLRLPR